MAQEIRPAASYEPAERVVMSWRVPRTLKAWLVADAEASGRSLSQQIELQLERARDAEHGLGGPKTAGLLRTFANLIRARFGEDDQWFLTPEQFFTTVDDVYEVVVGPRAPNFDGKRRWRTMAELPEVQRQFDQISEMVHKLGAALKASGVFDMADDDPRLELPVSLLLQPDASEE